VDARQKQLSQCSDPAAFDDLLREAGHNFQLLTLDPGGRFARVRFTGYFEGRRVIWDCTLSTLAFLGLHRNFIDVGEQGGAGVAIDIGLDLPSIEVSAIQKTIIMVRQYKLLSAGRHEFGPDADT
jgi:hypothetical protein